MARLAYCQHLLVGQINHTLPTSLTIVRRSATTPSTATCAATGRRPVDNAHGDSKKASGIMRQIFRERVAMRKVLDVILVLLTLELCFFLFKQALRWIPY